MIAGQGSTQVDLRRARSILRIGGAGHRGRVPLRRRRVLGGSGHLLPAVHRPQRRRDPAPGDGARPSPASPRRPAACRAHRAGFERSDHPARRPRGPRETRSSTCSIIPSGHVAWAAMPAGSSRPVFDPDAEADRLVELYREVLDAPIRAELRAMPSNDLDRERPAMAGNPRRISTAGGTFRTRFVMIDSTRTPARGTRRRGEIEGSIHPASATLSSRPGESEVVPQLHSCCPASIGHPNRTGRLGRNLKDSTGACRSNSIKRPFSLGYS